MERAESLAMGGGGTLGTRTGSRGQPQGAWRREAWPAGMQGS